MKAIKYLVAIIIFALSTHIGFAENDGTSPDKISVNVCLKMKSLFPVVPAMADFSDAEIENITTLLTDLSMRLAPKYPMEATFADSDDERDEILLMKSSSRFAPEQPEKADFDDQLTDKELFSPDVPLYAPYSEAL